MYRTFLNDIFSDDNEDIKVRLDTTPRTDNYNRIAAANTPDYAAGLGALSNYYDNKNNALQTQLDFAKNNYNQSNKKALLDAILSHEQNMFNLRSGHEKDLLNIQNSHRLGIMDKEHFNKKDYKTHENEALLKELEARAKIKAEDDGRAYTNAENIARIGAEADIINANNAKNKLEAEIARQEREDKRAYDKSLIDKGINPQTMQFFDKNNTVPHGGISLKKSPENVGVQNNAINTTPNAQNGTNNVNTINNNGGMSENVDAAIIEHNLKQEQKAEANKNFNIQNTMKNQYGDHYTAGMNINRWGFGDTKNKMPKSVEENINVDPVQHNYQRMDSKLTPDNPQSFASLKNRLNVTNQHLLNIENLHNFMDLHKAGFLPNSWEDVDAGVKTGLLNKNINLEKFEPILGPEGEFYLFDYDTGNIYGFDSIKGFELVSMPEQQSTLDYIGEGFGNAFSKRGLDIIGDAEPLTDWSYYTTLAGLHANEILNKMDEAGANYIANTPWLREPVDKFINWFKKR